MIQPFIRVSVTNPPERVRQFVEVFGTNTVPVKGIIPVSANLPDFETPVPVYLLDLDKITPEQRARLVDQMVERFKEHPDEIREALNTEGMPIIAEGTTLITNILWFL